MRLIDKKRKKYAVSIGIVVLIIASIIGIKIKKNSTIASVSQNDLGSSQKSTDAEVEEIAIDACVGDVLIQDEEEEKEPTEEEIEEGKKNVSTNSKYYIKINYQANVVTIYQKGEDDELTPIKAMTCSTGTATPRSGVYSVQGKWTWGALFGNVWGHYVTKIVGNILFHSVPYLSNDPGTLEYWEYDKLGTSASAGCVRLSVADAQWIFNNMPVGTPIEFYGSSDPGPLGKPGTRKISDNVECRGWDPTDSDPNNPWRNYNVQDESKTEEPKENTGNQIVNTDKPNNQIGDNNNTINSNTNTSSDNNQIHNGNNVNTNNTENNESTSESTESTNETSENKPDNNENNQETNNSQNDNPEESTGNSNSEETVETDNNQE